MRPAGCASQAGAVAIITDSPQEKPREGVAWALVPHGRRALARVNAFDPSLHLDLQIDFSNVLLDRFDDGAFDAVIVRREGTRRGGELLLEDDFGWIAAPAFPVRPSAPSSKDASRPVKRPVSCAAQGRDIRSLCTHREKSCRCRKG